MDLRRAKLIHIRIASKNVIFVGDTKIHYISMHLGGLLILPLKLSYLGKTDSVIIVSY